MIRGTRTPLEWLDDFSAQPVPFAPSGKPWGQTTQGFKALFDDLGPQINDALSNLKQGGRALRSVFVTVHSLGAALAHLATACISAQYGVQPISYTFCGPRAGDPQFADVFKAAELQTWRIINTEDIVPTVPPAAVELSEPNLGMQAITKLNQAVTSLVQLSTVGYQHIGYPIAVTFHRDDIADNHSLDNLSSELSLP